MHRISLSFGALLLSVSATTGCSMRGHTCEDTEYEYSNMDQKADFGVSGNELAARGVGIYQVQVQDKQAGLDEKQLLPSGTQGTLTVTLAPAASLQVILSKYIPCQTRTCNDNAVTCFDRQSVPVNVQLQVPSLGLQENWMGRLQSQRVSGQDQAAGQAVDPHASFFAFREAAEFQGPFTLVMPPPGPGRVNVGHTLSFYARFDAGRLLEATLHQEVEEGAIQSGAGDALDVRYRIPVLRLAPVAPQL